MKDLGEASFVIGIEIHQDRSKGVLGLGNISSANQPLRANRANQLRRRGGRGDLQKCNYEVGLHLIHCH